ncbi:HAMP domain-containing histidine kinase [Candidatus Desantisbacteria bacterium]|nr:HAMP domain-containing histidine kinase [Candidatus Desantisbacteria bacterium]
MKTIVLLTKDKKLMSVVEKTCNQQGLLVQFPSTVEEWNNQLQSNNGNLAMLDLDNYRADDIRGIPAIIIGQAAAIFNRIDLMNQCEDIIPKPVMPEVLVFKLNKVIENRNLAEELKKCQRKIKKLDVEVEDAYDEWEKIDRVLKASLLEVEKERNNLKQLNQQLEKLNKMKSEFLITISHELRTPLSSIKAFTEILMNDKIDPMETLEFLQIISIESDRLDRLINNLLMMSRIETGKICWKMQTVSINEIIEKAVDTMQMDIKEKELSLEINIPPDISDIYGDKEKLVDVVGNLLSNAVNFSHSGGTIRLNATEILTEQNRNEVLVCISDTGVGINLEEQEKIFDKFYQIKKDILTDKPKGMGLGLAICKEIIEHHGGRIWVESRFGEGSSFSFSLPVGGK